MLLDLPASLLYRHGVNLYRPMRVLCTDYRCVVRIVVALTAVAAGILLVPRLIQALGLM